jgi:hypothetical protein
MSLQSNVTGWATGVNWYLLAAKAAVILALIGGAYMEGKHRCELANSHKETAAAQTKYVNVVHEVQVRVPVIQEVEKKTTEKNQAVKISGDKLDEANKSPTAGSCNLSADQLRQFQELAKATQH